MKAADTIAPPGIRRLEGYCAALFIARRFRGDDRTALLQECGLAPYEPAKPVRPPRGCATTVTTYRRPGR